MLVSCLKQFQGSGQIAGMVKYSVKMVSNGPAINSSWMSVVGLNGKEEGGWSIPNLSHKCLFIPRNCGQGGVGYQAQLNL